ncbi:MAG: DUF5615 family PIN-like protein [Opitutaceae bacterium]|nr:DUF5615 family PIN-like protein [Cytophagales bacterium]
MLDQNLSHRLASKIHVVFPEAVHVNALDLVNADDFQIFMFARQNDFKAIYTQYEDFYQHLLVHGQPPKIIWVRTGNCATDTLATVILSNAEIILGFLKDTINDCLEIYQ